MTGSDCTCTRRHSAKPRGMIRAGAGIVPAPHTIRRQKSSRRVLRPRRVHAPARGMDPDRNRPGHRHPALSGAALGFCWAALSFGEPASPASEGDAGRHQHVALGVLEHRPERWMPAFGKADAARESRESSWIRHAPRPSSTADATDRDAVGDDELARQAPLAAVARRRLSDRRPELVDVGAVRRHHVVVALVAAGPMWRRKPRRRSTVSARGSALLPFADRSPPVSGARRSWPRRMIGRGHDAGTRVTPKVRRPSFRLSWPFASAITTECLTKLSFAVGFLSGLDGAARVL